MAARLLLLAAALAYVAVLFREAYALFYPPQCTGRHCFTPLLSPDDRVDVRAWVGDHVVWQAADVLASAPLVGRLTVPIPEELRLGYHSELFLRVTLSHAGKASAIASARVRLVRRMPLRVRTASMLLEAAAAGAELADPHAGLSPADSRGGVPHFLYSSAPCVLRLTTDTTHHSHALLPAGDPIGSAVDHGSRRYAPFFYADTFSLLRRHAAPLSSNLSKAHPSMTIKIAPISLGRHRLMAGLRSALETIQGTLGMEDELEEIRDLLSEERIYRFVLMQIIGFLHIIFDVLAFKNDMGFWKGREDMRGLSSRSVLFNAGCTLVIYLYLLDSDSINSIVLASYSVSLCLEMFKVVRVLQMQHRLMQGAFGEEGAEDGKLQTMLNTERFDELATRTLTVGLSPLVVGWALYSLHMYPHKGWYSWVVSSLADAIYLFGFIAMTPQLFINYRLKSVAHLPWRVLCYKAFNTFIDDVFAMMVSMPTAHRVACLRDDAVFMVYLYQRYLYPVDKARANEYGIAYERSNEQSNAVDLQATDDLGDVDHLKQGS